MCEQTQLLPIVCVLCWPNLYGGHSEYCSGELCINLYICWPFFRWASYPVCLTWMCIVTHRTPVPICVRFPARLQAAMLSHTVPAIPLLILHLSLLKSRAKGGTDFPVRCIFHLLHRWRVRMFSRIFSLKESKVLSGSCQRTCLVYHSIPSLSRYRKHKLIFNRGNRGSRRS